MQKIPPLFGRNLNIFAFVRILDLYKPYCFEETDFEMRVFSFFISAQKLLWSNIIQIKNDKGVTSRKAGTIIQNQGQYFSCPAYCPTGMVLKNFGVNSAKKLPIASLTPGPQIYDVFLYPIPKKSSVWRNGINPNSA